MTDREKLVDIVCGAMQDECVEHCNHPPCYCVATIADALIANGVKAQEWISVEDRLPEDRADVILHPQRGKVAIGYYNKAIESWVQFFAGVKISAGEVTHWMPLPEVPKEETL